MAGHRSSSSPDGDTPNARNRWLDPEATVTTDIIPFNEFGKLGDLEFHHNSAFDRESQVIHDARLVAINRPLGAISVDTRSS